MDETEIELEDEEREPHRIFRDGKVHVCEQMCETCIFRPGNLMQLRAGRVRQMVDEAKANDSAIVCHATLDGDHAVCRGYYDRHRNDVFPLRLAQMLDNIVEIMPPSKV